MKLKLTNVRMAFANIFTAKAFPGQTGGTPKFNASFLLDPKDPQVKKIEEAITAAATEKWGAKAAAQLTALRKTDKTCLHDGDAKAQYQGFEGMVFVSASNALRPTLKARDGQTPIVESDGKLYSGCYVNAVINTWAQDNQYGKRINAELQGIQFHADGDAFGGGATATDEDFDDLGDQGGSLTD
jgi:hypothetical protein